tara:strand:+ start:147 stop:398 length:252 start_codon:yes stop_codon:yes gene_type:complete
MEDKNTEIKKLKEEIYRIQRKVRNLKYYNKTTFDFKEKYKKEKEKKKNLKEKDPQEYKKLQERRKETNKRYREKQKKILNNNK